MLTELLLCIVTGLVFNNLVRAFHWIFNTKIFSSFTGSSIIIIWYTLIIIPFNIQSRINQIPVLKGSTPNHSPHYPYSHQHNYCHLLSHYHCIQMPSYHVFFYFQWVEKFRQLQCFVVRNCKDKVRILKQRASSESQILLYPCPVTTCFCTFKIIMKVVCYIYDNDISSSSMNAPDMKIDLHYKSITFAFVITSKFRVWKQIYKKYCFNHQILLEPLPWSSSSYLSCEYNVYFFKQTSMYQIVAY